MTGFSRGWGKRIFDLALTVPALLFLAPVMGVVGLAVRLRLGTPVLFRQQRPGLRCEPFAIYRFRTMTDERDEAGTLQPEIARLLGRTFAPRSIT